MGILDGFVQGAAEQSTNLLNDEIRSNAAMDKQKALAAYNAELADRRERTLMELRQKMADAPLNRIGAKAKEFAGQDVQLEVPPVTELSGNPTEDLKTGGMRGNYEAMVAKAKDLPPEDQKPYLDQLKKQYEADTATAKAGILGQTRKRTADESLDMAVEDAKINDLPGYTAYENTVGKTKREERRIDVSEARAQSQDDFNRGRLARNDRLDEIRQATAEARARRAEGAQSTAMEKAELQSQRQAVTSLMTSTERELERNMALLGATFDDAQKKTYQGRVDRLTKDLEGYRAALESFSGGRIQNAEASDAPKKDGGDSQGKPVPAKKDQLVVGETYSTARGLAKWNGTSFEKTK